MTSRIVILISGRGSNMQAIVRCAAAEAWSAKVVAVIASRPEAAGLGFARECGIPAIGLDHRAHASREAFDAALATEIDRHTPDLVVLAGFMRILGKAVVQHYAGRLLNIHPSLLPAFPGLHTHQRAIDAGCKVTGATVHFVTPELDHGPIVMQSVVPVLPGDNADSLASRILTTEHVIYPRAVRWFVEGQLQVEAGIVRQRQGADQLLLG